MNETDMTKVAASFLDELSQIQKRAGVLSSLGGAITGGVKALSSLGGKGAAKQTVGGLFRSGQKAYKGAGGGLKGAKAALKSKGGQAATVAGLGGLAGYGGYKALGGGQPGFPQRY